MSARKSWRILPTPWWCESEPPEARISSRAACSSCRVRRDRVGHALGVEAEVEVDAHAGLVGLRDAAGEEQLPRQTALAVLALAARLHTLVEPQRLAPRHAGLEALGDGPVLEGQVADVRDAEGELVAALAVGRATLHAAVLLGNAIERALLERHLLARALEDDGGDGELKGIEALHLGHHELLDGSPWSWPRGPSWPA
jgi:hypothetical protein